MKKKLPKTVIITANVTTVLKNTKVLIPCNKYPKKTLTLHELTQINFYPNPKTPISKVKEIV